MLSVTFTHRWQINSFWNPPASVHHTTLLWFLSHSAHCLQRSKGNFRTRVISEKRKTLQYQIQQYPHLNHLSTTVKSESPRLQHPPTGWPHCDYDTATLTEAAAILWVDPGGVRRSVQMFGCVGRADSCLQNIPANATKASYNY